MFLNGHTSSLKLVKKGNGFMFILDLRINLVQTFILYELVNNYYPRFF